ncbi:copper resistance protein NlpE [Pontibacter toksunensis]|uniref:Copper resistance protein NlpE n=1 Tax=Pontibacter toksunensis TaxID=1332631 RepID=A0ABW6C4C9_9BACT
MKTIFALLVLFSVALSQQQVQAQEVQSYEEWRKSLAKGNKKATKPAAKAATAKKTSPAKTSPAKATAKAEGKTKSKAVAPAMAAPAGYFTGTLPCSDCQGIISELELTGDANGSNRSFSLKQTYLGKPADKNVLTSSGKWFLAKGNKQDPNAVVLQLIPTSGKIDPMYFLQVSETEVKLLDRQQAEIKGQQNFILKRQ